MKMFDFLNKIGEYFSQIRRLEGYLVFDLLFPNSWKIPKRFVQEDKFLNNGETEEGKLALSFICDFTSKDVEAVAILQQLVNDAKKEIATKFVNDQDAEARKIGKMVANKKDAIKTAASKLSFDEDTIYAAYARELGVKL